MTEFSNPPHKKPTTQEIQSSSAGGEFPSWMRRFLREQLEHSSIEATDEWKSRHALIQVERSIQRIATDFAVLPCEVAHLRRLEEGGLPCIEKLCLYPLKEIPHYERDRLSAARWLLRVELDPNIFEKLRPSIVHSPNAESVFGVTLQRDLTMTLVNLDQRQVQGVFRSVVRYQEKEPLPADIMQYAVFLARLSERVGIKLSWIVRALNVNTTHENSSFCKNLATLIAIERIEPNSEAPQQCVRLVRKLYSELDNKPYKSSVESHLHSWLEMHDPDAHQDFLVRLVSDASHPLTARRTALRRAVEQMQEHKIGPWLKLIFEPGSELAPAIMQQRIEVSAQERKRVLSDLSHEFSGKSNEPWVFHSMLPSHANQESRTQKVLFEALEKYQLTRQCLKALDRLPPIELRCGECLPVNALFNGISFLFLAYASRGNDRISHNSRVILNHLRFTDSDLIRDSIDSTLRGSITRPSGPFWKPAIYENVVGSLKELAEKIRAEMPWA